MYKLLEGGFVYNEDTQEFIPPDPGNRHYQEYLKWKAEQAEVNDDD